MGVLMDLTNNIDKFSSDQVSTFTVPGREQTIEGTSYYLPEFEKTWRLVDKEFQNFKLKNWDRTKAGIDEDGNILDGRKNQVEEDPVPQAEVEAPVRQEIIEDTEPHYYEPAPSYEYEYYEPEYVEEEVEEALPEEAPKEKEESPKETEEKVEKSDTSDKDE